MGRISRSKKGKVAIVTGAARGLGRAFAERLAAEEAAVVAVDREEGAHLAQQLLEQGASAASFVQTDVSDETQVERLARSVLEQYGRCDIIVNNAGIAPITPLMQITLAEWRRTMAVNVESMFLMSRAFVPAMIGNRYGRIVNLASDTLGSVVEGFCHYVASKGAVVGFTRALANELGAHGVTANCIAPGLTRTPHTESTLPDGKLFDLVAQSRAIKRHALPADLVGAMSFLTSDDSAFITGQTLVVNGGSLKAL